MPSLANVASKKLQELTKNSLNRQLMESSRLENGYVTRNGKTCISFSCNDYLGLSQHAQVKQAAIDATLKYGSGAGASRLITGNHPLYWQLEQQLADYKQTQAALVYGSGYLANMGVIQAVIGKQDLIIADKLSHACMFDGARLSGATLLRFKHNDWQDCERILKQQRANFEHCLIMTEAVFSMDGDVAPLPALKELATQHDAWLMVDAAHSLSQDTIHADIITGTFSKAFGSYGGYVCGDRVLMDYLLSTSRSLLFTTGLPPSVIAANLAALEIIRQSPALSEIPLRHARFFTGKLGLPEATSQIVPLITGSSEAALKAQERLLESGFLVSAIRPPTVPEGTSRLRFTFSAQHSEEMVRQLVEVVKEMGLPIPQTHISESGC